MRITPAYAGKTLHVQPVRLCERDHPRVCGKDFKGLEVSEYNEGSPPRMRERRLYLLYAFGWFRITPAYAGKTHGRGTRQSFRKDHPRVCGKDFGKSSFSFLDGGSPPRMRERRILHEINSFLIGITPAYAGKTRLSSCWLLLDEDHPRVCGKDAY